MDLDVFVSNLSVGCSLHLFELSADLNLSQPYIFNDTKEWCTGCNSTGGICSLYTQISALNASATLGGSSHPDAVSPVGAGFIGFAVTTAVFLATLAVLAALGVVSFGAASKRRRNQASIPLKAGSLSSQHSQIGLKL